MTGKTILLLISFFLFIGCSSSKQKIIYIEKPIIKYRHLPSHFYKDDIILPKPPNTIIYVEADPIKRENMLTNLIIELYKTIGYYKIKLKYIKKYENNASRLEGSSK